MRFFSTGIVLGNDGGKDGRCSFFEGDILSVDVAVTLFSTTVPLFC